MKLTARGCSEVLNLILIATLILVLKNSDSRTAISSTAVPAGCPEPAVKDEAGPGGLLHATDDRSFRWSDLLTSNNYREFVATLRSAGCPEATVEDIVRGDAGRVFEARRMELNLDETQPGMWSAQSEQRLIDRLLGRKPTMAVPGPIALAGDDPKAAESTMLAAFLQTVDFTGGAGTEEQRQQVASLRQSLLEQMSDTKRVLKAEEAESMVGGLFGMGAAVQYDQYRTAHPSQN